MKEEISKTLAELTKELLRLSENDSILAIGYCEAIKDCILTISKEEITKKQILKYKDPFYDNLK